MYMLFLVERLICILEVADAISAREMPMTLKMYYLLVHMYQHYVIGPSMAT